VTALCGCFAFCHWKVGPYHQDHFVVISTTLTSTAPLGALTRRRARLLQTGNGIVIRPISTHATDERSSYFLPQSLSWPVRLLGPSPPRRDDAHPRMNGLINRPVLIRPNTKPEMTPTVAVMSIMAQYMSNNASIHPVYDMTRRASLSLSLSLCSGWQPTFYKYSVLFYCTIDP
jgi:hypothetical protein